MHPSAPRRILLFVLMALSAALTAGIGAPRTLAGPVTHQPILAGAWYPEEPEELRALTRSLLDQAQSRDSGGRLAALIAPHAGYQFSGRTAAHAYKLLEGRSFDTVVILAPSHRFDFQGVAAFEGAYSTPLGEMESDAAFLAALMERDPDVRPLPEAHAQEHAVEIQLPLLQTALAGRPFKLVPLVVGRTDQAAVTRLAEALAALIKDKPVLLVASTDLSHFHPADEARAMDALVEQAVARLDPEGLAGDLAAGRCEACGEAPLRATLLAARMTGADWGQVLAYSHSGQATGDSESVVGYLAGAIWSGGNKEEAMIQPSIPIEGAGLTDADRELLHRIAREAIRGQLDGRAPQLPADLPASVRQLGAAFVTLTVNGRLRGCIGHIEARLPLADTVADMARAAAFHDPRFPPVQAAEYDLLRYEISVLTPLHRITDPNAVQVGTHGLLIRKGGHSGLLLPQVPVEWGWSREQFLEQTCRKAGLPPNAWRDPAAEIYTFTAEVF